MAHYRKKIRAKLVRDRISHIIRNGGAEPITYIADDAEYVRRLRRKLREEELELVEAMVEADTDRVAEEAADVLEVVRAIAAHHGVDPEQLEKIRAAKALERGGFAERIVWVGNR